MTTRRKARDSAQSLRCPACGVGAVELVLDGAVSEPYVANGCIIIGHALPWRWKWVPFGACNVCEFCIPIGASAPFVAG